MSYNSIGQRQCYSCHEFKDTSEFHKRSKSQDGLEYYCKQCKKTKNHIHYQEKLKAKRLANKPKYAKLHREYMKIKRDEVKQYIQTIKAVGCCVCDEKTLCCLDFHHINPEEKDFAIAQCDHVSQQLLNEISKCVIVCSNCHRKIHAGIITCPTQSTPVEV